MNTWSHPQAPKAFCSAIRAVAVRFDHERSSSDGGAVPVEAADRAPGLTAAFAGCLRDRRQPSEVLHSLADMLRQRIHGLACG